MSQIPQKNLKRRRNYPCARRMHDKDLTLKKKHKDLKMNIYFEALQISLLLLQKSLHPTEQQHSLGCSAYSTCRTSLWVATNGFHSCICTGWVGEGGEGGGG